MKGTAILFREDKNVTIIEDIDHERYEEIKCELFDEDGEKNETNDERPVFSAPFWHENEVDWDYGY